MTKSLTVDVISRALAARIRQGEYAASRRLPAERVLSEQFATTRITLREALGQLEAEGLVYRSATPRLRPAAAQPLSCDGRTPGARRRH